MRTVRCFELIARNEFRYPGNESLLIIIIFKKSVVAEGLYGFVVGELGPKIR
jgi:hypothetical protein